MSYSSFYSLRTHPYNIKIWYSIFALSLMDFLIDAQWVLSPYNLGLKTVSASLLFRWSFHYMIIYSWACFSENRGRRDWNYRRIYSWAYIYQNVLDLVGVKVSIAECSNQMVLLICKSLSSWHMNSIVWVSTMVALIAANIMSRQLIF